MMAPMMIPASLPVTRPGLVSAHDRRGREEGTYLELLDLYLPVVTV